MRSDWQDTEPPQWSTVTVVKGSPPRARSLHAGVVVNDTIYVHGGYDGSVRCNDFHRFSFSNSEWSLITPDGPSPSARDRHVAVAVGGSIFIFGGYDGTSRTNDLWEFDISSSRWKEVPPAGAVPTPRHSHSAVELSNSKLLIFGGYNGNYCNDLHEFCTIKKSWSLVETKGVPPKARYRTSLVSWGSSVFLFGGHDGSRHLNDLWQLEVEKGIWSKIETPGFSDISNFPVARDSHSAVVSGDRMVVFGGSSGVARNDLLVFDLRKLNWTELIANGSSNEASVACARFCHVGLVYKNDLIVFGGYDGQSRLADFKKLALGDPTRLDLPKATLAMDLQRLVGSSEYSDVTFIVEDMEIPAHRVLCSRSPYFRVMFDGRMSEGSQKHIKLPGVSRRAFLKVLQCVYSDEATLDSGDNFAPVLSIENSSEVTDKEGEGRICEDSSGNRLAFTMEVFMAADQFGVDRLKRLCEQEIVCGISVENAAAILQAADVHNAVALRGRCLDFILRHFDAVSKSAAFEDMAKNNVTLLLEVLKKR